MRKSLCINEKWIFIEKDINLSLVSVSKGILINLPHTWNAIDGQDGGNDYIRSKYWYVKEVDLKNIDTSGKVYLEFKGVNASADVYVNKQYIGHHDGGYSAFRFDISEVIKEKILIYVNVDNGINDFVYPQKADFTFYGGIYRDVNIISVPINHFDLSYFGSKGVKVNSSIKDNDGVLNIASYVVGKGTVFAKVFDQEGKVIYHGTTENPIIINQVHKWQGMDDPYLYHLSIELINNNFVEDSIDLNIGFRTFDMDPNSGFYLNGKTYALRGVCRHQDRPGIGNALSKEHHDEDIELIKSVGTNTIRLAHYQHDDYFYDLCDKYGFIVWAEIPYISKHMQNGNVNAKQQMQELIIQQYHHPSIVVWGISNEITISFAGKDCFMFHQELNEVCHSLDDSRKTVIADYMPTRIKNKLNRVPDLVSYNLYFGWYLPFTSLAGWKLDRYHKLFPNEVIGLSEYGAEGMTNIHNRLPRRGDNTEAYQAIYHEKMIKIIEQRDYLWATHLWNMFDFAADARNQGGDPGMNHKGLITFDRKTKKDAYYIYKAYWSKEPFVHLCNKRYTMRTGNKTEIKVYTNLNHIQILHNDHLIFDNDVNKIAKIKIVMKKENRITVIGDNQKDESTFYKVKKKPESYKLKRQKNESWEK